MYHIVGADNQPHGPIAAATVIPGVMGFFIVKIFQEQ